MDMIPPAEVLQLLVEGHTYKKISQTLQSRYSIERGLSERSVRFIGKHDLQAQKTTIIEEEVKSAVQEVNYCFFVCVCFISVYSDSDVFITSCGDGNTHRKPRRTTD